MGNIQQKFVKLYAIIYFMYISLYYLVFILRGKKNIDCRKCSPAILKKLKIYFKLITSLLLIQERCDHYLL